MEGDITMTTEEKIKYFSDVTIENASNNSAQIIDDYTASLNKIFEDHKVDATRQAKLQITLGKAQLEKDKNKDLSKEQLLLKKELNKKQDHLKEKLFIEVGYLLEEYMSSRSYQELLVEQINAAKEFAKDTDITIYIDDADSNKLASLITATNTQIHLSEHGFMGGTKAVIHSKNILIDNSFETKLKEAKDSFAFTNK